MYSFGFAALALLPFQIGRPLPTQVSGAAVAAFAGLVLFTTIAGYGAYTLALRHLQASVASILAMSEVLFAAFFGYVLLGERMNGWQILGALVIIGAVVLLTARSQAETAVRCRATATGGQAHDACRRAARIGHGAALNRRGDIACPNTESYTSRAPTSKRSA